MKLTSAKLKQMIREALATQLPLDYDTPMGELEKKMESVAKLVDQDYQSRETQEIISELTNILATISPTRDVDALAAEALSLLRNFGYQEPSVERFRNWKAQMEKEMADEEEDYLDTDQKTWFEDSLEAPMQESASNKKAKLRRVKK